jgi:hypothetical protein
MAFIIEHIYMAAARDCVLCINPVSNYIKNYSACIKQQVMLDLPSCFAVIHSYNKESLRVQGKIIPKHLKWSKRQKLANASDG